MTDRQTKNEHYVKAFQQQNLRGENVRRDPDLLALFSEIEKLSQHDGLMTGESAAEEMQMRKSCTGLWAERLPAARNEIKVNANKTIRVNNHLKL